jgi:hypothetical protein
MADRDQITGDGDDMREIKGGRVARQAAAGARD